MSLVGGGASDAGPLASAMSTSRIDDRPVSSGVTATASPIGTADAPGPSSVANGIESSSPNGAGGLVITRSNSEAVSGGRSMAGGSGIAPPASDGGYRMSKPTSDPSTCDDPGLGQSRPRSMSEALGRSTAPASGGGGYTGSSPSGISDVSPFLPNIALDGASPRAGTSASLASRSLSDGESTRTGVRPLSAPDSKASRYRRMTSVQEVNDCPLGGFARSASGMSPDPATGGRNAPRSTALPISCGRPPSASSGSLPVPDWGWAPPRSMPESAASASGGIGTVGVESVGLRGAFGDMRGFLGKRSAE